MFPLKRWYTSQDGGRAIGVYAKLEFRHTTLCIYSCREVNNVHTISEDIVKNKETLI